MADPQWCFADFRLDPTNARLWQGAQVIALTPKVFDVLHYLVTHADRLVTKDTLLDAVWSETAVSDGVVRMAIGELRRALGDTAQAPRYIATVQRRGYRFVAPVTCVTPEAAPSAEATPAPLVPPSPAPPLAPLPPPEAERRHLTVLFCDLISSTALATRLDPEDYREVVRAYHQTCAEVIQQFEGYVAQYLGDGVLGYFGYPVAHEDDAPRAVRAGLAVLEASTALRTHPVLPPGEVLAMRLGVHTGLVVVGDVGAGARHEPLALGETPNIAARLQHLAEPNTLVLSAATYQLVAGYFRCKALGAHTLHGLAQPLEVYRVLSASGVQSRLEVAATHGLTPLVGREQEVGLLTACWTRVTEGTGQVVLLGGEAGIGKSRLVQVLKEHVAGGGHAWLECQGSPYYQHTALYPLTELLARRLLHVEPEATAAQKVQQLEGFLGQHGLPLAETVPLFAPLLSLPLPATYAPVQASPEQQRQQTLHALLGLLLRLAAAQPLLLVMEDLHWVDPSTLEWLSLLVDQGPTTRILTLCTFRPDFTPLWTGRSHLTQIMLARLPQRQTTELTHQVAQGKALPAEVVAQIVAKTDGVPLFVEEVTKTVLESGLLQEQEEHYALTGPLPPLAIPVTLHDALLARLDRLGTAKGLAQLGATLGREFAYALLQAVAPWDEETLRQGLQQLVGAELLYQRGLPPQATYVFKHTLIQDAAYQSLLRRTRQQYHQRIAQVVEARFPELCETQPELVARHYTEAGLSVQAIPYWQQAGQWALQRSAHAEAVGHLSKGLTLLLLQPDTPARMQQELGWQIILGRALQAMKGYAAPEVEHAYTRAWNLSLQMEETPQLFPMFVGMQLFYVTRAELAKARQLAEQCLRLAERAQDPVLLVEAHTYLGLSLCFLGDVTSAREHLGHAILLYGTHHYSTYTLVYGHDPGVLAGSVATWTLWLLGDIDQALQRGQETLTFARELAHAHSLAFALWYMIVVYGACRSWVQAETLVQELMAFAPAQGLQYWLALGTYGCGWVGAGQGQYEAGIALMRQGITAYQSSGARSAMAWMLCGLAEVYGKVGQVDEGLRVLAEMSEQATPFHEAELWRVQGGLLAQQGHVPAPEAEACFSKALEVARRQEAKSLELRAATSLARLWQQQGKRDEARVLLAQVYGWFTEGFDTADLQDARALLEELA